MPSQAGEASVLWPIDDLLAATAAVANGLLGNPVTGVSIDTRTISPGDLFVALKDARDGHEFVTAAFENGAAAALVRQDYTRRPGDGLLLYVDDPLAALERLGRAARARLNSDARVIAVTGSAGKTTTKEMLRTALSAIGPTHASEKSYNNHWGVPLTLARMPAASRFGIFEIGMNHAGEITPLSRMVRPHISIITSVGEAHIENFPDGIAGIARAKAEIFAGASNGWAIIPYDCPHYPIMAEAARARQTLRVAPFLSSGPVLDEDRPPCAWLLSTVEQPHSTSITAQLPSGLTWSFAIGLFGHHNVSNSLAVATVIDALAGADFGLEDADRAFAALATVEPPAGRGARHVLGQDGAILLIDESYNANPSSMRAALDTMAAIPRADYARRVAVLGDMLELGVHAPAMHAALSEAIAAAGIDLVMLCGPNMHHLLEALPVERRGAWGTTSAEIEPSLLDSLRPGDVVMIKGSNGSRMGRLVEALKQRHSKERASS